MTSNSRTLFTPGEQIIKYFLNVFLEIFDNDLFKFVECVDCFYMRCLSKVPTRSSHKGLDQAQL
jgi:hypothetical protein